MTHKNAPSTDPSQFRDQAAACLHLPKLIDHKPRPWFRISILRLWLTLATVVPASSQAQDFQVTPLVLATANATANIRAVSIKGTSKVPERVRLQWQTEGGTAVPGRDYLPASGSDEVGGRPGIGITLTILPSAVVGTSFGVRFSSDSSPESSLVKVRIVPKVGFSAPQYHWQGGPFMEIPMVLSHPAPEDLSVIVDGISAPVLKGNTNGTLRLGVDSLSWPASLRFSESGGIPGNGTYLIDPTESAEILPPGWDPGWMGVSLGSLLINAAPGERPYLTLLRQGSTGQEIRVRLETLDGTAVAGRDYEAQTAELVFQPNESWKEIALPTFKNREATQPRSFEIKVTPLSKGLRVRNERATVRIGEWDQIPTYAEGLEGREARVSLISPNFPNPIPPSRVVIKDRTARAQEYFAVTDMTAAAGTSELVLPVLDNPGVQGLRQVELEVSTATAPFLTNHVLLSIVDNEVPNALDHAFLGPGDLVFGPQSRSWVRADDWIMVTREVATDRAEALLFTPDGALESRMMLPAGLLPWRDPHLAMPDGRWVFAKGDPARRHTLLTWKPGGGIEALDIDLPSGQISALHVAADGRFWVALSSSLLGPRLYELEASGRIRRRIQLEDLNSGDGFFFSYPGNTGDPT